MNVSRLVAWLVAIVWFAWAAAIDTQARTALEASPWLPDIGVTLFVAWAVRIEVRHLMMLACLAALSRDVFAKSNKDSIRKGSQSGMPCSSLVQCFCQNDEDSLRKGSQSGVLSRAMFLSKR